MNTGTMRTEGLCEIDGVACYRVPDIDRMPPFLVTVVSPSDHWLYVSSNGGLTAGRVNNGNCLFPYRTDDLIHQAQAFSGPWTGIRIGDQLWEPFSARPTHGITRDLARSVSGDRIVFEETNPVMGLRIRAWWAFSERSGFVRTVTLERDGSGPATIELEVVDGLRDLVAGGADLGALQTMSCLINAYTRAEQTLDTRLAAITMESALSDRAEPAESLEATTVWSTGLPHATVSMSSRTIESFAREGLFTPTSILKGHSAAYLLHSPLTLGPDEAVTWSIVSDVSRSQAQVADLHRRLDSESDLAAALADEIDETTRAIDAILVDTDGMQCSGDPILDAHHRTNTLFNDMRGGVFVDGVDLPWRDWVDFCRQRNSDTSLLHRSWLESRDDTAWIDRATLVEEAASFGDPNLERIAWEYLPVWFGRRHGDPSRPWNAFNIRVKKSDGERRLTYEGNWRDIFQNWEALAFSNPGWIDHVIAKFLNASTPDGFNPYRITREGIDWEAPEPDNPWSNIGYWGDHQIGYLTRLLELSLQIQPGRLDAWLDRRIFSLADVPYRLADHSDLIADPRNTISFDDRAHKKSLDRADRIGADGRLVHDAEGHVVHVSLAEKLVIPVLSKLSAFVPDGGIWMNTQRPEWNDANNALAGYGLSMVTASYLRRHLVVLKSIFSGHAGELQITDRVADWMHELTGILDRHRTALDDSSISDRRRRGILDELGKAFETYRHRLSSTSSIDTCKGSDVVSLCDIAIDWLDHAIRRNRREDGLYHGYNLVSFEDETATVHHLPEMLEGQVAVLSSGTLDSSESAELLERLFQSALHRNDHDTFLLYPIRDIPAICEKGVVDPEDLQDNPLLSGLARTGDTRLIETDGAGVVRFATPLRNKRDVAAVLDALEADPMIAGPSEAHRNETIELYERIFDHHRFTGRSGGMYGYEGIGCTYWHMVSKLLVATGECVQHAEDADEATALLDRLRHSYHRIRDGLGFRRSAAAFGALPIDAYSHTPGDRGAQQPGMTGQVKEELITRRMELGLRFESGEIRFTPSLILEDEWRDDEKEWSIPAGDRAPSRSIPVPSAGIGFQMCGVPVVYRRGDGPRRIHVTDRDGNTSVVEGHTIDASTARGIFERDGQVSMLMVDVSGR
ncbi:MAG: hypothetical protein CBB69_006535 [Phycisphaera sp. TMED9]|nr:MAG: hypothetical protein CBB69_006535 [Phycisphaera sp. TMED9]